MKDLHDVHLANKLIHIGFHETGPELRAGVNFSIEKQNIDGWQQKPQKMQSNTNMFRSVNSYYDDNKTKP